MEGAEAVVRAHHFPRIRVYDRRVKPSGQSHGEKCGVDVLPQRQAEGNIGDAKDGPAAQLCSDAADRFQNRQGALRIGADGHTQGVDQDILFADAVALCLRIDPAGDGDPAVCCFRDPLFVERQGNQHAPVMPHKGKHGVHDLPLSVYGIDERLSVVDAQRRCESLRI